MDPTGTLIIVMSHLAELHRQAEQARLAEARRLAKKRPEPGLPRRSPTTRRIASSSSAGRLRRGLRAIVEIRSSIGRG